MKILAGGLGNREMTRIAMIVAAATASVLAACGPACAQSLPDGTAAFAIHDYAAAVRKIPSLAARGNAEAQALLGFMYEHGRGVAQDYVAAAYWYRCAAEQGYPTAQYLLGLLYDKGHGVPRSDMLAYTWLNLAAGNARQPRLREYYLRLRDAVASKLSAGQIAEAQWLGYNFLPKVQP